MMNHAPYTPVPSGRDGLRWWLLGRDRRHPFVVLPLVLAGLALVAVAIIAWVFSVAGLIVGAGTGELARRHGVAGWAWPLVVACGLVVTIAYPPLGLVALGSIGGAVIGNRHRPAGTIVQYRGPSEASGK